MNLYISAENCLLHLPRIKKQKHYYFACRFSFHLYYFDICFQIYPNAVQKFVLCMSPPNKYIHCRLWFDAISVFPKVSARFCEGGHRCSPPKECCAQGCCYLYAPPSAPRTPPPSPAYLLNNYIYNHWILWWVLIRERKMTSGICFAVK